MKRIPVLEYFSWQQPVLDKDLNSAPLSPTKGDRYIVATGVSTGDAWYGHEKDIAWYNGSIWQFDTPSEGWQVYVEDESNYYIFDSSSIWTLSEGHSHDNKTILDAIEQALTTVLKTAYDDAVSKEHEHSNKATLDLIEEAFTSALKTAYDSCVTNEHTHANKAILDNIEVVFTTALKNAYDSCVINEHTHANKVTLDLIEQALTSALKTAYDDAVTKAHEHSNKTELDKVTDGDHDVISSGNPHSVSKSDVGLGNVPNSDTTDAINKAHTQGTDQKLDEGGGNEVTVVNIKDSVDKKHAHSNILELDLVTDGNHDVITTGNPHDVKVEQLDLASGTIASDVDDAVDKKHSNSLDHTQDTDTKLDNGGANEVSASNLKEKSIIFEIDGGGVELTTGEKSWVRLPFAGTIVGWELTADQAGDIEIDIWKDVFSSFPPTVADTIMASASTKPNLSSEQSESSEGTGIDLSGWDTSLSIGDYLRINVDSIATVTKIKLILRVEIS